MWVVSLWASLPPKPSPIGVILIAVWLEENEIKLIKQVEQLHHTSVGETTKPIMVYSVNP